VSRMQRAQVMAFDWERHHRKPWRPIRHRGCAWRFPDWPYTHMEAASLLLDGYPVRARLKGRKAR
jgi:hypothetical protein